MFKSKKLWAFVLIVLVGVGGYFLYNKNKKSVITVERVSLYTNNVRKTVSGNGEILSEEQSNLSVAASGVLENLTVKEGASVKKGTIVGNVFNYDLFQSSESAKDARDVAKRDYDLYVENYSSNVDAVGGEDEYYLNLRRLNELVEKAEATYQATLGTLSESYLKIPFDGTVIDVAIENGETVIAGSTVLTVANLDKLIFEVGLDQEDFGLVMLGQPVEIVLDAYEDEVFTGTVSKLPLTTSATTEEFEVEIIVTGNGDRALLVGMQGDADIIIEKDEIGGNALPFDAIFTDDNGSYVWSVQNGVLTKQRVTTGLEGDLYTVVQDNIDFDSVVIPLDEEFSEGDVVKFEE